MEKTKLPHVLTLVGIIVLLVILVGQRICLKTSFPEQPMQIVLDRNIPLLSLIIDDDEQVAKLRKGDTVSFLGVVDGTYHYPYGLLVQTKDGERGLLAAAEMGFPMLLTNKKDSLPVTVKSVFREKSNRKGDKGTLYYNVVTASGEKKKVHMHEVRPILPDSLADVRLLRDGDYFMTKEKFEQLFIGKKLDENDARFRPAWMIDKTKKGFLAYYPNIEIVDVEEGTIRNPMIVYGADSVATVYGFNGSGKSNNRWVIKWLPLLGKITDSGFFASFIEGSIYTDWLHADNENYTEKIKPSFSDVPFYYWVGAVLWIIFGLIWVFALCTLPSLILDASLYCRYIYFHLNDGIVSAIFGIVAVLATYIWVALAAVWGCLWIFLPVIIIAGCCAWAYSARNLNTSPHTRCPDCRRMETIGFVNRTFDREYDEWRKESEAIDSHTETWKTWTDVTTTYGDGHTSHTRENERNHSRTTTLYADFRVLYHVKVYHNNYKCAECGYREYIPEEELKELDREFIGQHTSVSET